MQFESLFEMEKQCSGCEPDAILVSFSPQGEISVQESHVRSPTQLLLSLPISQDHPRHRGKRKPDCVSALLAENLTNPTKVMVAFEWKQHEKYPNLIQIELISSVIIESVTNLTMS